MPWALIPLRNGRPLDQHTIISLEKPIGRRELLESTWKACQCGGTCPFCEPTSTAWATVLSRQLLRVLSGNKLQVRGINAHRIVRIDGKRVVFPPCNDNDWTGNLELMEGMILTLKADDSPETVLEYKVVKETFQCDREREVSDADHHNGVEQNVSGTADSTKDSEPNLSSTELGASTRNDPDEGSSLPSTERNRKRDEPVSPINSRLTSKSPPAEEELSSARADVEKDAIDRIEHDKGKVEERCKEHDRESQGTPDLSERAPHDEPLAVDTDKCEQPESPALPSTQELMERIRCRIEVDALTWDEHHDDMNQVEHDGDCHCHVEDNNSFHADKTSGWDENGKQTGGEIPEVDSVPVVAETPAAAAHGSLQGKHSVEVMDLVTPMAAVHASNNGSSGIPRFNLFFLHRGVGSKLISIRANFARSRGASVTTNLDGATHLVISGNQSCAAVASALKFSTPEDLYNYLTARHIETVKWDWIEQSDETLKEPTVQYLWHGLASFQPLMQQKSRKRQRIETTLSHPEECRPPSFAMNLQISACFQKLSKLHQDCPLLPGDQDFWKAYTLQKISGRLKHLDFEIKDDAQVLQRLRKVDGIGESTLAKIKEFLKDGTLARIEEFEKDESRVAMKIMMHIWGVGAARAKELLNAGYRTIPQVRHDVGAGKLVLTRNQTIGLECYEDFLEKMDRKEVEAIGDIVTKAVLERFPKASVMIMGSYRRGKSTCGDIDLLITHPDYVESTPIGALGELADRLRQRGHIAYHLTHLTGMRDEESSQSSTGQVPVPPLELGPNPRSSSYMGVFYSPTCGKKRRRIDIKFYPYRERVFASLYFTGNGWFNRSMRQWSRRRHFMSLNDHGFFSLQSQRAKKHEERLPIEAETERQVFDQLGLVYREPTERDCFDDVIPLDGRFMEMDRSDAFRSSNEKWID